MTATDLTETRMEAVARLLRELDAMVLQFGDDLSSRGQHLTQVHKRALVDLRQRVSVIERIVDRERREAALESAK